MLNWKYIYNKQQLYSPVTVGRHAASVDHAGQVTEKAVTEEASSS